MSVPLSERTPYRRRIWFNVFTVACCVTLCAIFAFLARSAAIGKCATFDEPAALVSAWVQAHYFDFRVGPENPPLYKFVIGLGIYCEDIHIDRQSPAWNMMLTDMNGGGSFIPDPLYGRPEHDVDRLLNNARLLMIASGIALGAVIAWWAWRLRGSTAGVVALAAFCFDPNILAHAPLLKNDLPVALAFTTMMAGVWLIGERATVVRWLFVSLMLGAALVTKFSGVFGIPVLAVALFARAAIPMSWPWFGGPAPTRLRRMGVAALLFGGVLLGSYIVVWAAYGFRFEISNEPGNIFDPGAITRAVDPPRQKVDERRLYPLPATSSDRLLGPAQWALRHKLLPEGWIAGFVFIQNWSRSVPAFLCGKRSSIGWWYYFPLAILFKTPVATLLGMALAIGYATHKWLRMIVAEGNYLWPTAAFFVLPVMYMSVAMTMHYDIGLRHVFPIYPFLFIGIGTVAADCWRRRPRLTALLTFTLISGLVVETLWAYPDFIPFFNLFSGGERGGISLLGDSNLDWGQDLPLLGEWQKEHPDRTIILVYFGSADPAYYGIKYFKTSTHSSLPRMEQINEMNPVYAISATVLQGTYLTPSDYKKTEPFRHAEPSEILGGSIYLFDRR